MPNDTAQNGESREKHPGPRVTDQKIDARAKTLSFLGHHGPSKTEPSILADVIDHAVSRRLKANSASEPKRTETNWAVWEKAGPAGRFIDPKL